MLDFIKKSFYIKVQEIIIYNKAKPKTEPLKVQQNELNYWVVVENLFLWSFFILENNVCLLIRIVESIIRTIKKKYNDKV